MSLKSINYPNLHIKCLYILQPLTVKERTTTRTMGLFLVIRMFEVLLLRTITNYVHVKLRVIPKTIYNK